MIRIDGQTIVKERKENVYFVRHWDIKKGLVSLGIPIPPPDSPRPSWAKECKRIIDYPEGKRLGFLVLIVKLRFG